MTWGRWRKLCRHEGCLPCRYGAGAALGPLNHTPRSPAQLRNCPGLSPSTQGFCRPEKGFIDGDITLTTAFLPLEPLIQGEARSGRERRISFSPYPEYPCKVPDLPLFQVIGAEESCVSQPSFPQLYKNGRFWSLWVRVEAEILHL